uniref:Accumulation-associated protein n=1 Tax=Colletotrichum fructicola (strain Nara gc5) TaxID=1213859 RepID=L2FP98_COLFN
MKLSRAFLFSTQLLAKKLQQKGASSEGYRQPSPKGAAENGTAAGGEAGAEGEGEKKENEKEIEGAFNVPVRLGGAGVKQDVLFPPGKNGRFEVEFQNAIGRTLTVTENRAPAPPPAGFTAVEAVSFKVNLAEGAQGMTLSKIDYILNPGNKLDISKGQIGRLFPEANAFIINPALGELEFEAEENELTLKVANMNGEFAVFLPQANGGPAGRA